MTIERVKLPGNQYAIEREGDGAGDAGGMLLALGMDGSIDKGEIIVGCCMRCGSLRARTMQWQDWWQTTAVVEIEELTLDDKRSRHRVKTKNSVYIVSSF